LEIGYSSHFLLSPSEVGPSLKAISIYPEMTHRYRDLNRRRKRRGGQERGEG
jgi:hypothetical protein